VQQVVADKMNAYYLAQSRLGMNLLGVLSLGDNFYYTGQSTGCGEFVDHWSAVYKNLTDPSIQWLATMGNHDWGDSDEWAMCAFNAPTERQYIDPTTHIPYAANQLSAAKGGCNPNNFYLPDWGYFYSIEALSLEIIVLEESSHDCGDIGGGYGSTMTFSNCGGFDKGCSYLSKIDNATEQMLIERAKTSTATNILLMQHYPGQARRLKSLWKEYRHYRGNATADTVWTIFGHAHEQKCNHVEDGVCDEILSGGGGGCCMEKSLRGFYVVGFDDDGGMTQPVAFNDSAVSCEYPCNEEVELTPDFLIEQGFETCCHTHDADIDCQLFDLQKCSA